MISHRLPKDGPSAGVATSEFIWLEDVDGVTAAAFEAASQAQPAPEQVN